MDRLEDLSPETLLIAITVEETAWFAAGWLGWRFITPAPGFWARLTGSETEIAQALVWGLMLGVVITVFDLAVERLVGPDHFEQVGPAVMKQLPGWSIPLVGCAAGWGEEWFFRGFLQSFLPVWLVAVLFALPHSRGRWQNWPTLTLVFMLGWVLGIAYMKTASLIVPVVAHAVLDIIEGYLIRWRQA